MLKAGTWLLIFLHPARSAESEDTWHEQLHPLSISAHLKPSSAAPATQPKALAGLSQVAIPTEPDSALAWVQGRPLLASQDEARMPQQLNTGPGECKSKFYITPEHSESLGWEQNQGWAPCIK